MTATEVVLLRVAAWLAAGTALGVVFFVLLRTSVRWYANGRRWHWGVALHIARWAIVIPLLVAIARAGALPLLATSLGLVIARAFFIRRPEPAGP